jgi:hypothetical protein
MYNSVPLWCHAENYARLNGTLAVWHLSRPEGVALKDKDFRRANKSIRAGM